MYRYAENPSKLQEIKDSYEALQMTRARKRTKCDRIDKTIKDEYATFGLTDQATDEQIQTRYEQLKKKFGI